MLPRSFYNRDTLQVAQDLLGKFLVFGKCSGEIVETEAYLDKIDPASHSYRGKTQRNAAMFGLAGQAYVYFIYGNHYCFNVVTEKEGIGAAVLIRAVRSIEGLEIMQKRRGDRIGIRDLTNGPGKLCRAFGIGSEQNGWDLCQGTELYIEDRGVKYDSIEATPRIGIKNGKEELWRFVVKS